MHSKDDYINIKALLDITGGYLQLEPENIHTKNSLLFVYMKNKFILFYMI